MTYSVGAHVYNHVSLKIPRSFSSGIYSTPEKYKDSVSKPRHFFLADVTDHLRAKHLMAINFETKGGFFYIHYAIGKLLIEVAEKDYYSMVQDFKSEIADYWDYIAKEDDSALSDGAKSTKQWLLKHFEEK